MKYEFRIWMGCNNKFYIEVDKIWDGICYTTCRITENIAPVVGLSEGKYLAIMIKKYNGHIDDDYDIYFDTKKIAEKARDYLESIVILNKLTGEVNEI
jgi:hypothetical protein